MSARGRAAYDEARRARYASDPEYRAKIKASRRAYYLKNKERIISIVAAWTAANRDRKNANKRKRYAEAHQHFISKGRTYAAKRKETGKAADYRQKTRLKQRAWCRERSARITDGYARELLSKYSPISAQDWPKELVEAKKIQIQIKRLIKNNE